MTRHALLPRLMAVAMLLTFGLAACKGSTGSAGAPGADHGQVTGVMTSTAGGAAAGVSVSTLPAGAAAVTNAAGAFTLTLPVGVYSVVFTSADYAAERVDGVSVVAGGSVDVSRPLTRVNPLVATAGAAPALLAGFGQPVALSLAVTGATGPLAYSWTQTGGPTAVTLSSASAASPTFTTGTFAEIVDAGQVHQLALADRPGLVPISVQQSLDLTYTFDCTVTDGTFTTIASASVQVASPVAGLSLFPLGLIAIANDSAASYSWSAVGPSGSVTLSDSGTRNPWFIPAEAGTYTLTNGVSGHAVTLAAKRWVGAGTASTGCVICHDGGAGGTQYTTWSTSGHASILKTAMTQTEEVYTPECIVCHTIGWDPASSNGGFDDVAASLTPPWELPPVPDSNTYASLPAPLLAMAGVQCEHCHGPGGHSAAGPSYDAKVCAHCHDALPDDNLALHWAYLPNGHANVALASTEGLLAPSCQGCHTAQGFAVYANQILSGDATPLATPVTGLGAANVQAITCQACHLPHADGVRIEGSLATAAGFSVSGAGTGALCVACHNTRNGAHDDANPPTSFEAPHAGAQADVLFGRNAFFASGFYLSGHTAVQDTCVGCHMKQFPTDLGGDGFGTPWDTSSSNHTFVADGTICGACHGTSVDGVGIQAQVAAALAAMKATAEADMLAKLGSTGNFWVQAFDPLQTPAFSDPIHFTQAPTAVALAELWGVLGFTMHLATPVTATFGATTVTLSDVSFQLSSLSASGTTPVTSPLVPANSDYVKALWNYDLLASDRSKGIHNRAFVAAALQATSIKLANPIP
jgi:hypothetical protein